MGRKGGQAILRDLFHRQVRFYGPEDLIVSLQKPEIAGKLLTIEGRLYPKERRFLITVMEEVTEVTLENQQGVKIEE